MSVFASLKKTAGSVAKFMGRYADEASGIADALRTILPALGLNANDRRKVSEVIERFDNVADGIGAFLKANPNVGEPVKIRASDLDAAVARYFADNPDALTMALVKAGIDAKEKGDA